IQLELEDLPILNPPLDLLNLLPMPEVSLVQQSEPPDLAVGPPDTVKPEEQQPVDPSDGVATEPIQPTLEPQLPTPIDASKPVVPARLPSRERDLRSVLALTPLPTWREQPVEIPAGEALGRFTISPEPNLDTSETEPGSPSSVVLENQTVGPAGETASVGNSASVGTLTFEPSVGAKGKSSSRGRGGDTVPGSRPGSSASGPGVGSGWGAGSSPSKGALAGITIVGGIGGTETSVNSVPDSRIPHPLQTRYGLFVVSTENSGGGLPYFDVFSNAQITTVYLDMRQRETDAAPFWTLEFAVPRGTAIQANPAGELDESYEGFVLPVPVVKQQPALPLELVRRHIGKMIIVFTVINVEGKMEQISVKESPDPLWNQPVLDALSKWVFRPGVLNGDPVAVEAMLGIPLWSPVPPGQRPRLRRTSLAAKGSRRGR
ncbi:MAG: energy transducer TonB, partial [Acidobacteria bacterium]|nr:energy transducer TonB [Acidobacteriota bacterium]